MMNHCNHIANITFFFFYFNILLQSILKSNKRIMSLFESRLLAASEMSLMDCGNVVLFKPFRLNEDGKKVIYF